MYTVDQPWAKCCLFAAVALRPIFCGLLFEEIRYAHTLTSFAADESPDFLSAAGKTLHRANSAHPTPKLI